MEPLEAPRSNGAATLGTSGDSSRNIVCWGEVLWDLFPDGPRLGGCAGNVAHHLVALGDRARLVTRLGNDELGERALGELVAAGIDLGLVQRDAARPTGTVRVQLEGGEPRFNIATEAAWDAIEWSTELEQAVLGADVLYFGTLAQRTPLGSGALARAWSMAPAATLRVCDLNLRAPFVSREAVTTSVLAAHVVKLNEAEAAELAQLAGTSAPVRWLLEEQDVLLVALTRGADGCSLFTRDRTVHHPGFPLTADDGDRVGAGDAFTAVLCHDLARQLPLEAIAERANRVASYVASHRGATPPLPPEIHGR